MGGRHGTDALRDERPPEPLPVPVSAPSPSAGRHGREGARDGYCHAKDPKRERAGPGTHRLVVRTVETTNADNPASASEITDLGVLCSPDATVLSVGTTDGHWRSPSGGAAPHVGGTPAAPPQTGRWRSPQAEREPRFPLGAGLSAEPVSGDTSGRQQAGKCDDAAPSCGESHRNGSRAKRHCPPSHVADGGTKGTKRGS